MSQGSAYQHLAKEFMDLWQKQISAVISDKQFIQAMLELFQSIQAPASHENTAPASSRSADAPDAGNGVLAELAFRVAMCEKRLAVLEQKRKSPVRQRAGTAKPRRVSPGRR